MNLTKTAHQSAVHAIVTAETAVRRARVQRTAESGSLRLLHAQQRAAQAKRHYFSTFATG